MKKILLITVLVCTAGIVCSQSVGIGTNTPHASAMLDISAADKGLLVPRIGLLSPTDITTVPSPATGLLVYNSTTNTGQMPGGAGLYMWNGSWTKLLTNEQSTATNAWTTRGNAGTNPSVNFIGTTDNNDLLLKRNNIRAGLIDNDSNTVWGAKAFERDILTYPFSIPYNNVAIGYQALTSPYLASKNTAVGVRALYNTLGVGNFNTAVGFEAGISNNEYAGEWNTYIGALSGTANTPGVVNGNSIFIGYASVPFAGMVSQDCAVIGNSSTYQIGGMVGWQTYSDARIKDDITEDVPGLPFIMKLRPLTYYYNIHRLNKMIYSGADSTKELPDSFSGKYAIEKIKMTGFAAQEVEQAARETGFDFSGVIKPASPNGMYALRYDNFIMPLVKAVQEQQQLIGTQQKGNALLQQQIDILQQQQKALLEKLERLSPQK